MGYIATILAQWGEVPLVFRLVQHLLDALHHHVIHFLLHALDTLSCVATY
jgi:hypothetical protein